MIVDLITNSSTEIYVEATQSTIKTIKELINNILESAGDGVTKADDLFTFELEKSTRQYHKYDPKQIALIVKSVLTDVA